MLKLFKYEFKKTLFMKLIMLGITVFAELLFLIGVYASKTKLLSIGFCILIIAALLGVLVIGLQSVITLHRDMNTKQGYMLFMTPHSSCAILGAKVLECSISILLTGGFYLALGLVDAQLLLKETASLEVILDYLKHFIQMVNDTIPLNFNGLASLAFLLLCSWICTITTIYLADVISSSLLNGKRGNGLLSFLIFIVLNVIQGYLGNLVPASLEIIPNMLASGGLSLVFAVIMYIVTFKMMDRYLSV